ncbi:MAG: histidinol dehydrogenase [Actinomycetota bacterium]
MLVRVDVRGQKGDLRAVLARPVAADPDVTDAVREIVATVRTGGDAALRDCTRRFDGVELSDLRVPADAPAAAWAAIPAALREAMELAADQIRAWHETQVAKTNGTDHQRRGVRIRELAIPVDRAGCYVPGGRAVYPSTVLMTAIPARVAGTGEVVLCVPPGSDGLVPTVTLAAAALAGVDAVHPVGGAHAIAALAYGTESIAPVDVVVGPGNAYVTEAKRQVAGVVGIDSLAGPSEIAIVADRGADPELVAADLLAQAEHGPGGAAAVITWDDAVASAVERAVERLLVDAVRHDDAAATLATGGRIVLVDDAARAIDAANAIAPEHLQLMCADADALVDAVRHAGAVFVGMDAPAVLGDYVAGVNHVLPTGGAARFASALRVADFQRQVHVVSIAADGLAQVGPAAIVLADAEGLYAHADALRRRGGDW